MFSIFISALIAPQQLSCGLFCRIKWKHFSVQWNRITIFTFSFFLPHSFFLALFSRAWPSDFITTKYVVIIVEFFTPWFHLFVCPILSFSSSSSLISLVDFYQFVLAWVMLINKYNIFVRIPVIMPRLLFSFSSQKLFRKWNTCCSVHKESEKKNWYLRENYTVQVLLYFFVPIAIPMELYADQSYNVGKYNCNKITVCMLL